MFLQNCKPTDSRSAFHVLFIAVGCISSLLNFGVFLLLCYLLNKYNHLRTPCNIILWGIFLSDSIVNMVAFPIRGIGAFCNIHTFASCQLSIAITRFSGNISSSLLVMLTIERYIKIAYYIYYPKLFSHTRTKIGIFLTYLGSFLLSCVVELDWNRITTFSNDMVFKKCFYTMIFSNKYGIFVELGLQMLPLITTIILHCFIFHYVRTHLIDFNDENTCENNALIIIHTNRRLRRRKVRVEIKLAITAFLLCGVYIIFVLPIVVIDLIQMFEGALGSTSKINIPDIALQFSLGMVILYPSVEGLVLLFTNPGVFKYFYAMISEQHVPHSTTNYTTN